MNPARIQKNLARFIPVTLVLLVFSVLPAFGVTVTDDAGTTITLEATPSRIVSLAPSNTEILAALGLLDRLVGVTDVCDYPPEVKNVTRIGGYSGINIEKVAAAGQTSSSRPISPSRRPLTSSGVSAWLSSWFPRGTSTT